MFYLHYFSFGPVNKFWLPYSPSTLFHKSLSSQIDFFLFDQVSQWQTYFFLKYVFRADTTLCFILVLDLSLNNCKQTNIR